MKFKIKLLSFLLVVLVVINVNAQKDRVLFTVNGDAVYSSEFSRVYEKNLSLVTDPSQKEIDNYLDLYINYKLKLEEAYELKMDTIPSYIKEYNKYKKQLIDPYLKDEDTEKDLIAEAYDRLKQEVKASHILLKVSKTAKPEDTLKAYTKLENIRKRIVSGADFGEEAKLHSEDPSAKKNAGSLGYFTAFQMVYPFETAAYTTPVGEISPVFRTKFGYHIVKVEERRASKGEIQVAHIMLSGDEENDKTQIENLKKQLDEGADFATLAKTYSKDPGSAKKGGVLAKFGSGRMVKDFESVAFSLQNENDISEPFKTRYGWHIIKLLKKYPVGSFEDLKPLLQKKVIQGQRAKILGKSVINRLLKEYTIVENIDLITKKTTDNLLDDTTILSIEGEKINAEAFYKFLDTQKRTTPEQAYQLFKETEILNYYKKQLPTKFPALKNTLKEYEEGLLLFDLMQDKIWTKAEKDSTGLAQYFEEQRAKYQWKERADAIIVSCDKRENTVLAKKMFSKEVTADEIKKAIADKGLVDVKEGAFEKDNSVFPEGFNFDVGVSDIIEKDGQYTVVYCKELLPAGAKSLAETRGKVISKYQDYLEKEWITQLKKRYPVKVIKKSLKKIKKKYN